MTNDTLYDYEVLLNDTEVIRGVPIDDDQRKTEKKLNSSISRCFLKTDKIGTAYRALTKLACRPTLTGGKCSNYVLGFCFINVMVEG